MLSVVTATEHEHDELRLDLDQLVREGARRMLAVALEAEVDEYLAAHSAERDEGGRRLVVRNGRARQRQVTTAAGAIWVRTPRVDDRRADPVTGQRARFRSVILPPWCRKSPKVAEVLPLLYLHGLSTGDFVPALEAFFGSAVGLSAAAIDRLLADWQADYQDFCRRDLSDRDYVYCWADGVHFRVRLQQAHLCCLVIVGVRVDGTKELVAVCDGERESTESWAELLRDLRRRGMRAPAVMVGDGALGLWAALRDVFPPPGSSATGSTSSPTCSTPCRRSCRLGRVGRWSRSAMHPTATTPSMPSRRSPATTAPSGPRRSPRWLTTPGRCLRSSTFQPSTGCT
jgi:transposase-like protein